MGLGYVMTPFIQIKISTIAVMKESIAKFGFSSCTYMAIPTSCVCSCIRVVKPLTTEMCRTISGSSLSLWPFRKGYRVFSGFFPTKRDHLGRIYSLEFFLKLLQFLIFFFHTEDRMWISVLPRLTPLTRFVEKTLRWEDKLLIAFVNQSSAPPCRDFTHYIKDICNNSCSWAHHLCLHCQLERSKQSQVWFTWQLL